MEHHIFPHIFLVVITNTSEFDSDFANLDAAFESRFTGRR